MCQHKIDKLKFDSFISFKSAEQSSEIDQIESKQYWTKIRSENNKQTKNYLQLTIGSKEH